MDRTATKSTVCYRHRTNRSHDELDPKVLHSELALIPSSDRDAIANTWDIFAQAPAKQRIIILRGLLSACCSSQLSYLATAIQPFLRIDFTQVLPLEICVQIFSYLDAQSLCVASQVSKHWRSIADDDVLWHRLCQQHIDRKCAKCGWGLPLLQKRRVVRVDKRPLDAETPERPLKRADRKPWKSVYSERLVVERNWRKQRFTAKTLTHPDSGRILCLQYCEAQNIVMAGSTNNTVTIWDLETSSIIRVLHGHTRSIRTLQFDDTKLVTGSMDQTLKIWNYHKGQCIRTLQGHTEGVVHLHFDSRILASGSADATIKIWNFQTGQCFTLTGHTDAVTHVRIMQHQHQLVSSSGDGTIRVWDLTKRSCTHVFQGHKAGVQIAVPSMPGFVHRFLEPAAVDAAQIETFVAPDDHCSASSFAPVVLSGSLDNTVKVWSLDTGKCLRTLFGHTHGVGALAFDKLRLVTASFDGAVKLWDIQSGLPMYSLPCASAAVTSVILKDSKVICGFDDGAITIWDFGASP